MHRNGFTAMTVRHNQQLRKWRKTVRLIESIESQVRTCNEILDALKYLNDFSSVGIKNAPEDWGDHIMFIEDERDRLVREKTKLENGTHEIWAPTWGHYNGR
jgi:hypothetical protein